jgi:type 1 glutamine amidotransferase
MKLSRHYLESCCVPLLAAMLVATVLAIYPPSVSADQSRVLVFSKTAGWRHESIIDGKLALLKMGEEQGFGVDISENAELFVPEVLSRYNAVIFLSTTGELFNEAQRKAFQQYIRAGGAFVGIHAATDTENNWPWYNKLVGAYFAHHPENQYAEKVVLDFDHPSTAFLKEALEGNRWRRYDEWYNFRDMNPDVKVLLNLDEKTYEGGRHGDHHPIAWYHEYEGARVFYTGGGHTRESYSEPLFLQHILGGIRYVLGE